MSYDNWKTTDPNDAYLDGIACDECGGHDCTCYDDRAGDVEPDPTEAQLDEAERRSESRADAVRQ